MLGYEINYLSEIEPQYKTHIRQICVPFNFTESAYAGLKYAAIFANMVKADITLLNCFQSSSLEFGSTSKDVDYTTTTYERKEEILEEVPELKTLNVSFLVEHDFFTQTLQKLSKEKKVDMIIMGSHISISADRQKILGTNASSLISFVNVPLLIVPDDNATTKLDNMMFAVDYKEFEDLESIETLKTIANIFDTTVHIVHVTNRDLNPYQIAIENKLKEIFDGIEHKFYQYNYPDVHNGLKDFTQLQSIDLMAMTPRKHGFIESLYKPSETKKMALYTKLPLLVIH